MLRHWYELIAVSHVWSASDWRHNAIVGVRIIHSGLFLSIAGSVVHIFYAGLFNRVSRLTRWCLLLAVGESVIFAANRFRCPLRQLAEHLGAESGQVTDIFLPRWFADRIPWIFTPLLTIGIGGLVWHRWRRQAPSTVERGFASGDVGR